MVFPTRAAMRSTTAATVALVVLVAVSISTALPNSNPGVVPRVQELIQASQEGEGIENTAELGGVTSPSITPSPSPSQSIPTYTVEYRDSLKSDVCDYLYELSSFLMPHYYADEPIREGLLNAAQAVGCWHEGQGAEYLAPELYKPPRGDHGPHPSSGYPYVIKAKLNDKRTIAINIKYDDPKLTGEDLAEQIAFQLGKTKEGLSVYRNKSDGHPIGYDTPLKSLGLKFQDSVFVDFDLSHRDFNAEKDRNRQRGFFARNNDPHMSLHGIEPN